MFEFAYPFMLLLLLTVPFIYIFAARHKGDGLLIVPNAAKIKKAALKKHYDPMPAIFSLTAVLLIIALARPRTGNEIINSSSEGIDISLAIDLSGSMDAIDIPEGLRSRQELQAALNDGRAVRRIDGAKKALAEFAKQEGLQ